MKTLKTKRFLAILTACVLSVMFVGCATDTTGGTETAQAELDKIVLSEVTHSVFYAPQYAAMELGFFEEMGIELELVNGGGADVVMSSLLSGGAQIGLAGPEAAIYVYGEGKEDYAEIFAQLTKRDGSFIVGREDEEFSIDNMLGKYIIGGRKGGVPQMTFEYVLTQNGIDVETDLTMDTGIAFNLMAGAFTGGTGDYVSLFEPTASMLEKEGAGYILASIGEMSGEIPYTAYFANKSYIAENADIITRFTQAVAMGQEWVSKATPEEIAKVIAPQFPDTDEEILISVAKRYQEIDAWNSSPYMEEAAFNKLQDVMIAAGELESYVPYDELFNDSFSK